MSSEHPSTFPTTMPRRAWFLGGLAIALALVEIQFAEQSWHLVYGFLSGKFTGILTTANQFPETLTVVAVGLSVWALRPEFRSTLISMALAIGISSLATGIIKEITGRARPTWGVRIEQSNENLAERAQFSAENPESVLKPKNGDYWLMATPREEYFSARRPWFRGDYASFPSGHATSAFAFALWLALLFPKGRWIWYTLAVLTCLARIRFRRHHPGDVLAGAGVGYLIAWLVYSSPWISRLSASVSCWVDRRIGA